MQRPLVAKMAGCCCCNNCAAGTDWSDERCCSATSEQDLMSIFLSFCVSTQMLRPTSPRTMSALLRLWMPAQPGRSVSPSVRFKTSSGVGLGTPCCKLAIIHAARTTRHHVLVVSCYKVLTLAVGSCKCSTRSKPSSWPGQRSGFAISWSTEAATSYQGSLVVGHGLLWQSNFQILVALLD